MKNTATDCASRGSRPRPRSAPRSRACRRAAGTGWTLRSAGRQRPWRARAPAGRRPRRRSGRPGDAPGHLVRVVGRGQPGADIEELPDPDLAREVADRAIEERPRLAGDRGDLGVNRQPRVAGLAVNRIVVLAAQSLVPDPRRVGDAGTDPRPCDGGVVGHGGEHSISATEASGAYRPTLSQPRPRSPRPGRLARRRLRDTIEEAAAASGDGRTDRPPPRRGRTGATSFGGEHRHRSPPPATTASRYGARRRGRPGRPQRLMRSASFAATAGHSAAITE
jgi:hypothetical protein